jgi:hypothetical protein
LACFLQADLGRLQRSAFNSTHEPTAPSVSQPDSEFTHDAVGVRRAGVTELLKTFEERGLISTKRGHVSVLDRVGLEGVAGDSYGVAEAEYARLIGLPSGSA